MTTYLRDQLQAMLVNRIKARARKAWAERQQQGECDCAACRLMRGHARRAARRRRGRSAAGAWRGASELTMPIKPENRARYPKDWAAISLAARERSGWRCQHEDDAGRCKACQYAVGHWERRRSIVTLAERWLWMPTCGNAEHDCAGAGLRWPSADRWTFGEARQFAAESYEANPDEPVPIVIVLTVAHLNHQPEDCRPENLAAMCQRHHLAYDHDHHRANAQATRRAKTGTLELF